MAGPGSPSKAKEAAAPVYSTRALAPRQARYDHVLTGYRFNYSVWQGVTGIFELHFETLNIWTHLLGLCWYLWQVPHLLEVLDRTKAQRIDRVYYYVFLAGCVFQMATSTAYHMWRNMSIEAETQLLRLDVLGVVAMIVGSYAVGLLNGFWCQPWLHVLYMCIAVTILGAGCGMMLLEGFQHPGWALARNLVLGSSVAFGLIPSFHWTYTVHCTDVCRDTFLVAMIKMFGYYTLGFAAFLYRFPERLAPGMFDLVGASHQWWHAAVWAAGSTWWDAMLRYYEWRATAYKDVGSVEYKLCHGTGGDGAGGAVGVAQYWWQFLDALLGGGASRAHR